MMPSNLPLGTHFSDKLILYLILHWLVTSSTVANSSTSASAIFIWLVSFSFFFLPIVVLMSAWIEYASEKRVAHILAFFSFYIDNTVILRPRNETLCNCSVHICICFLICNFKLSVILLFCLRSLFGTHAFRFLLLLWLRTWLNWYCLSRGIIVRQVWLGAIKGQLLGFLARHSLSWASQ